MSPGIRTCAEQAQSAVRMRKRHFEEQEEGIHTEEVAIGALTESFIRDPDISPSATFREGRGGVEGTGLVRGDRVVNSKGHMSVDDIPVRPQHLYQITGIHLAAKWKWKDVPPDLECMICHNSFEVGCTMCKKASEVCPPAFGNCSHIFHLHCIERWLTRNRSGNQEDDSTCPFCRKPWKFVGAMVSTTTVFE